MASNPYLLDGPTRISFSGGRTSAFMLKMIQEANGGGHPRRLHCLICQHG